jgi:hypothetical protein
MQTTKKKQKPYGLMKLSFSSKSPMLPTLSSFSFVNVFSISKNYSMDIILIQESLGQFLEMLTSMSRFSIPNRKHRMFVHIPTTLDTLFASICDPTTFKICHGRKTT